MTRKGVRKVARKEVIKVRITCVGRGVAGEGHMGRATRGVAVSGCRGAAGKVI